MLTSAFLDDPKPARDRRRPTFADTVPSPAAPESPTLPASTPTPTATATSTPAARAPAPLAGAAVAAVPVATRTGSSPTPKHAALRGTGELAAAPALTVLLVEDNAVNQAVARALLAQLRVEAVIAEDGRAALDLLEQGADDFAAVLMDCQMPILDGHAATRAWRARERALGRMRLPVIAMTANSVADAGAACTEAGMDDFMAKPFTLGQLEHVLARWVPARSMPT
jgi:CheY-like chemotaxis protein